jgi:hypothetical protein
MIFNIFEFIHIQRGWQMESGASGSPENPGGRYVDAEGFVRKERNNMAVMLWIGVVIANLGLRFMPSYLDILALLLWPISAYLLLVAIQIGSSHDIDTWKGTPYVKLWIFLSSLVAGLLGLIAYEILKRRERSYLKKGRNAGKIGP